MRNLLCLFVALFLATPVLAGDGNVPHATLKTLGLGGMQAVSDAEGMQIRGMSSSAFAFGASLLSAQLVDPANPGNFLILSDVNGGQGSDENAGLAVDSFATQGPQGSSIVGLLDIQSGNPAITVFLGSVLANAGHASNIGAAGFSAATGN